MDERGRTVRTLVAGFGNVLRADDGFGVEVVRRLEREIDGTDGSVVILEVGTGGVRLVQELLAGFDRLILVDAAARGGPPGALYVTRVEGVEPIAEVDPHELLPARALAMARAIGVLPREVYLVGCEPQQVEELSLELSPPVREAVERAVDAVKRLLRGSS
jgi:hydrogenase maturation protease